MASDILDTEEDLVIGTPVDGEEEVEMEFEDCPSATEMIAAAFYAIDAVESMNTMTTADTKRKKRIMRKSIAIMDYCITELYDLLFDDDEQTQKEEE